MSNNDNTDVSMSCEHRPFYDCRVEGPCKCREAAPPAASVPDAETIARGVDAMVDCLGKPIPEGVKHYQEAAVRAILAACTPQQPASDAVREAFEDKIDEMLDVAVKLHILNNDDENSNENAIRLMRLKMAFARSELFELAAALFAPTTKPPRQQWQPIDTAPKDGTPFLAWESEERGPFKCWWYTRYDEAYWTDHADSEPAPTHWMPLPPAPEAKR